MSWAAIKEKFESKMLIRTHVRLIFTMTGTKKSPGVFWNPKM